MNPRMSQLPRLAVLLATLTLASACTESYDLTSSWTSATVPANALSIDNINGSVRLTRGAAGTFVTGIVKVHASGFDKESQAKDAAQRVTLLERVEGGTLNIDVAIPSEHRNKTFAVTLDLTVPEGVEVDVVTDNGRVAVNGLPVDTIDTTNGEVDLQFTSARAGKTTRVKTNNGFVTVDSHDGPLDASTSNADLRLFSINGSTRGTTTNGFIEARIFPELGGDIFLATTNSGVSLAISRSFGAQLIAVTTAPGTVNVDASLPFSPRGPGEGVIGDGRGRIDVRSTVGDIFIGR